MKLDGHAEFAVPYSWKNLTAFTVVSGKIKDKIFDFKSTSIVIDYAKLLEGRICNIFCHGFVLILHYNLLSWCSLIFDYEF